MQHVDGICAFFIYTQTQYSYRTGAGTAKNDVVCGGEGMTGVASNNNRGICGRIGVCILELQMNKTKYLGSFLSYIITKGFLF